MKTAEMTEEQLVEVVFNLSAFGIAAVVYKVEDDGTVSVEVVKPEDFNVRIGDKPRD